MKNIIDFNFFTQIQLTSTVIQILSLLDMAAVKIPISPYPRPPTLHEII